MENLVREIRRAAGMNQTDFARRIGRSTQMLQLYERGHGDVPAEIIEKLKAIAAEANRGDLGVALSSDEWKVRSVIEPGETLIGSHKHGAESVPLIPSRKELHRMLDSILDSGDPDALQAVVPNLQLFDKWVQLKRGDSNVPVRKRKA